MQAPTSPSGPPAKEPDERACVGCGAANGTSAAFCWQCYRPFAAPSGWTPGPTSSPFPTGPRSRGLGTMAVVVATTLAVIGGAWFLLFRESAVLAPEALGGMPSIDTPETRLVEDTFQAEVQTNGIEGDIVIYGNGTPAAALIWIRDASVPTTDAAFDEFAAGFNDGIGANGSLGKKQSEGLAGVTYVCAPVLGATPGTLCMWQDEDVFWLMFDFSGSSFGAGQDLAVVAHDAVEAA